MKKISFFAILVFLVFFVRNVKAAEEGFEIGLYYPYDYNILAQDEEKNKDLDFDKGQSGLNIQLKSPYYIGVGISIFEKNFRDTNTKYDYKLSNYFFDLTYKIPVPDFLNVSIGAGVGQAELECGNGACENNFKAGDFEAPKENISQVFFNLGFKVGYVYKLNFGFHKVNGGTVKFIDKNRTTQFKINGDANVFTAGISISFI